MEVLAARGIGCDASSARAGVGHEEHFQSVRGRHYSSRSGPGYCRLFMNREARRRLKWFGGTGTSFEILQTFSFPVLATIPSRKTSIIPNGVTHRDSARLSTAVIVGFVLVHGLRCTK